MTKNPTSNNASGETWSQRRSISGESEDRKPDAYHRDRARIIHSQSFRRLQAKTQVLGLAEGDFHRSRLTHSLEVAQIGMGITDELRRSNPENAQLLDLLPSEALITSICLAHDLGHPPFGHKGEEALNYAMRNYGGFEGNGQSLRIVSCLEPHTRYRGLNLTRRTLLGILKYPAPYRKVCALGQPKEVASLAPSSIPPKCYLNSEQNLVDWIMKTFSNRDKNLFSELKQPCSDEEHGKTAHCSFDASIMEIADDIAYGIHDLEDGIVLGFVTREVWSTMINQTIDLPSFAFANITHRELSEKLFSKHGYVRKRMIGRLVHAFILNVRVERNASFQSPLLACKAVLTPKSQQALKFLKDLVYWKIVRLHAVRTLEWRGKLIVGQLFEAIASSPEDLLRGQDLPKYRNAIESGNEARAMRLICDYVAGMTDAYAVRIYERLFIPRLGSVFERL